MTVSTLRICVATTSYPRNATDDAAIFVERLVKGFEAVGIEGDIVVPLDNEEQPIERRGAFVIRRFRYGIFDKGRLAFGAGILPNLRREPLLWLQVPALLICFALSLRRIRTGSVIHANWLFASFAAVALRLLGGPPVVVTCRGEDAKLVHVPVLGRILIAALRKCSAVVTVSDGFRKELIEAGLAENRVHTIPNGVEVKIPAKKELDSWARDRNIALNRKWLLCVGRVIPLKRIHEVIRVLESPLMADFSLIICGRLDDSSYVERLRSYVAEKKLESRVRFEGGVPPADIPFYLSVARYFISLSEYEGRPNAVVEAMAAGVPSIVSNIPAHRELVWDGKTGIIVADLEQTAVEIDKLEKNPESFLRVSYNARGAMASYGWNDAAKRYRAIFEQVQIEETRTL